MRTNQTLSILFAGLLLIGPATAATAQTKPQDNEARLPAQSQASPPAAPGDVPPSAATPGGMPGMGMMTPEMMEMMQRMMGQGGMPGMPGQGGMMGQGMMGQGMMGQGMMGGRAMMGMGMMGLTDAELTAEQRRQLADLHAERARRQFMLMHDLRAPRQRLRELMSAEELDVRAIGNAYDEVAKLQKDVLMLELRAQEEVQNVLRDATAQAP
jgi:hypothetical protein